MGERAGRHLHQRGGWWHYKRRVPADVADLDRRGTVRVATRTRDLAEALVVAARIDAETESYWRALAAGAAPAASSDDAQRYEAALRLARTLGVAYRPAADLARGDLADLVRRLELLEKRGLAGSTPAVAAVLGGAPKPDIRLSELFSTYETHARDRLRGKSEDQARKWRHPRARAVRNAVTVIGDKPLVLVTREDALDFRAWWLDRVAEEGCEPGSANKDLGHLAAMVRELAAAWRLALDNPFAGLRLAGDRHNPRTPYDPELVRARILPGLGLDGLNAEALGILRMVAATGMRPSEVAALTPARVVLDAPIPYVAVAAESRQIKTPHAARDVPLVGVGLEVMRRHADGFARYRDRPDALSATVNKALGAAGLRPTPRHTLYSLRHTFKDRLIAIEAPERVQDALMGHAIREIAYGQGPSLAQRAEWLERVWG